MNQDSDTQHKTLTEREWKMVAVLIQMMNHHRAQLPSEVREMLPHGCGCPLCEQARAALALIPGWQTASIALGLKEEQEHV
jgi:hypothetical protein